MVMRFKNSNKFREAALHFQEFGTYTKLPYGSRQWIDWWKEEKRRCLEGYEVDDIRITGYHYFYLNYSPILKVVKTGTNETGKSKGERIFAFPDFWDGDYDFFHYLDEAENLGKHANLLGSRGRGKEMPNYQPVITPYGEKLLGDLVPGDIITGDDGKPTKVLEVFPQGVKDVYELTLGDGRTVECGIDHLWGIYEGNKYKVLTLRQILDGGYKYEKSSRYFLPINQEVEYNLNNTLPLHPYIVGAMLGDGTTTTITPKLASQDPEIIDKFKSLLPDYELKHDDSTNCNYTIVYRGKDKYSGKKYLNGKYGTNPLHRELKNLKINVTCKHKFIPNIYKTASVEDRYELVRGLMDTDGSINTDGYAEFTNTSKTLVEDLAYVLRSLGIRCQIGVDDRIGRVHSIEDRTLTTSSLVYRLFIRTDKPIFYLSRKARRIKPLKRRNRIAIKDIQKKGSTPQTCIMIDNESKLFLTKDFVVTHNSFKAGSMCCRNYFHIKNSKSFAIASAEEFLVKDGILTKAWEIMDFIDTNTPWAKRRSKDDKMHRRAGIKTQKNGQWTEEGYKSEIIGITTGDDVQKIRGKRGKLIILEESGKFRDIHKGWQILRPSMEQDEVVYGMILAQGTGGEEGADFEGAEELFYNPEAYNIHSVTNKWDAGAENTRSSFFWPASVNYTGAMDELGNSNIPLAVELIGKDREIVKMSGDPHAITRRMAEIPLTPREAAMKITGTQFPVREIRMQEAEVSSKPAKYWNSFYIGRLELDKDTQKYKFEYDGDVYPIKRFPVSESKLDGGIVLFELVKTDDREEIPQGRYLAGIDSYDHNESSTGSLGSMFVIDTFTGRIVAEYTGRPKEGAFEFYETCRRLALYYNAICNIENLNKGIFDYFDNKNCGYLICEEPRVARESVQDTVKGITRRRGTTPSEKLNAYARGLIARYLLESTNNSDLPEELRVHTVKSIPLLQEMALWNINGNFDRVSALGMLMLIYYDRMKYNIETIAPTEATDPFWDKLFKRKNNSYNNPGNSFFSNLKF
jgi:hypothetical protein